MRISLKHNTLDLSVVIASLNEAPNLYRLLPVLRDALQGLGVSWEILVIDGNSTDGTQKVVEVAGARYVCETTPGYGTAIARGIAEAQGAFVLTMDADLSHPTEFIRTLWEARTQGDLVIASRYVAGGYADQPWVRSLLSRLLNRFFAAGLSVPAKDLSSGFRLYRKNIFEGMTVTFPNFVILIEILLLAFGRGLIIKEIPFHYHPRESGSSKARIIKFGPGLSPPFLSRLENAELHRVSRLRLARLRQSHPVPAQLATASARHCPALHAPLRSDLRCRVWKQPDSCGSSACSRRGFAPRQARVHA